MKILVACEFSGVVNRAFLKLGHDVISCDLLDCEDSFLKHYKGNVLDIINDDFDLMIAHPPCTYLCSSGAQHIQYSYDKHKAQLDAIKFFMMFANSNIPMIAIENPVGIMSNIYRKPDQIISPHEFGHEIPKKTCLWLKNLPKLIPTEYVEPDYVFIRPGVRMSKLFRNQKKSDRGKDRSRTFEGIASAMANQWGKLENPFKVDIFGDLL